MGKLNLPLSNAQIELLKLFSTNLSEKDLIELKDLLSRFYAGKTITEIDLEWGEKELKDTDMEEWLNENG